MDNKGALARYSYRDKIYSVMPCSKKDIPSHTERVLSYWKSTGTNLNYQKVLLEACIDARTSIKVVDEEGNTLGCLYWKPIEGSIYLAHFVWFKNFIVLGIGLDYIYKNFDCRMLRYVPHQRNKISYKSLLSIVNIRMFYGTNLAIDVDLTNPKIKHLYRRYYLDKGIKEV